MKLNLKKLEEYCSKYFYVTFKFTGIGLFMELPGKYGIGEEHLYYIVYEQGTSSCALHMCPLLVMGLF
jgi:hypothetical protein